MTRPGLARCTDPMSSHEAAADVTASGARMRQVEAVLALVRTHPGCTSGELAFASARPILDRYQVARRLPELRETGLVRMGDIRHCRALGTRAVTWWPVAKEGQLL